MLKYYTPEIEDLHMGLKVEVKTFTLEHIEWVPYVIAQGSFLDWAIERKHNLQHWLRIKYLDREDIESLGFRLWAGSEWRMEFRRGHSLIVLRPPQETWVLPDIIVYPRVVEKGKSNWMFGGDVKNIDELKVILKQVGVEYDE